MVSPVFTETPLVRLTNKNQGWLGYFIELFSDLLLKVFISCTNPFNGKTL